MMTNADASVLERRETKTKDKVLIDQEDALSVYLQSLLVEPVVEEPSPVITQVKAPETKNIVAESFVAEQSITEEKKYLSARVGGLTILIPAECIESVKNVTQKLENSSKMPVWIYELADDEDEPIQIVNSRKLIFGGIKSHKINPDSHTYAILLDDGAWGISCDSIGGVINLKNTDVTWRSKTGKRRWLAGTSRSQEAIVLDVKRIEKALIN